MSVQVRWSKGIKDANIRVKSLQISGAGFTYQADIINALLHRCRLKPTAEPAAKPIQERETSVSEHINAAVARMLEARTGGEAIPADFIAAHPLSMSDALEVQQRVQAAFGPVGGWKV